MGTEKEKIIRNEEAMDRRLKSEGKVCSFCQAPLPTIAEQTRKTCNSCDKATSD